MMVGREVTMKPYRAELEPGDARLVLRKFARLELTPSWDAGSPWRRPGRSLREILGPGRVSGNGQRELAEVITGCGP